MDKTKKVKYICELCARGEFQKALELLKIEEEGINDSIALKIIINVCSSCASNVQQPQNISHLYLDEILIMCVTHIRKPSENQMLSYSQSIFHILKWLLEKQCCDYILKLENVWLPNFLIVELPKKIVDIYQKVATLIHNFMLKSATLARSIDNSSWLKLNCLFLRISRYIPQITFMQLSYGCVSTGKAMNISPEIQEEFYCELLKLISSQDIQHSDTFEYVFRYTFTILSSILSIHDFEKAKVFYNHLTDIWKQLIGNEYVYLHRLLKLPLLLSTLVYSNIREEIVKCSESLKILESKLHSKVFLKVVTSLNNLIDHVMKFYKKKGVASWHRFSSDIKLEIYELFVQLAGLENKSLSVESLFQTFTYADYISSSINNSINGHGNIPDYYHKKSTEILRIFFDNVCKLKQMNYEKWKTAWDIVSIPIYNIGVSLFKRSFPTASYYFILFIREYMKLDGRNCLKLKFSMLTSILSAICTINAQDHRKKMAYSALSVHLCPIDAETFMKNIINIKYSKTEIGLQTVTLVSAFKIFDGELKQLLGTNYELNDEEKKNLLLFELRQYKRKWKSKLAMMHSLKELYETADLKYVVDAVVEIFGDCEFDVHENVPKIIYEIISKYESTIGADKGIQQKLSLSVLYMLRYKYRFREVIKKNACDMESSMSVNKKEDLPSDLIEECDIVSSYESLTLKVHLNNISHLDQALNLLSSVGVENVENDKPVGSKDVYKLLMKISNEYKLQKHKVRSLQALHLALKIAQEKKISNDIVSTITSIIDYFDIRNPFIKYLTFLADKELENLDASNIEDFKTIVMFLTVKSKIFLYIDHKESLRIFNVVNKMLEDDNRKQELKLICSQVYLQHYRLVMMPCKLNVLDHKNHTLMTIYSANSTIVSEYRDKRIDGSYELSLLLDTIEGLIEYYDSTRCPREVRSYCKEAVVLTQKLVLPLRCAVFLKYLAHADVRTFRNNDCHVKLNGISSILSLNRNDLPKTLSTDIIGDRELEKLENNSNKLDKMILDIPHGDIKQMSPSSPSICVRHTSLPPFFKHDEECNCFFCVCSEYQRLILDRMRLVALLNINQGYHDTSRDCFEVAIKMYETIQNRYDCYQEICNQFLPCGLIPEFDDEFLSSYAFILLEYGRHLANMKFYSLAKDSNKELMNLLLPRKNQFIFLWNEALVHNLLFLDNFIQEQINPIPELEQLSVEDSQNENKIQKTPENKTNQVHITNTCSPVATSTKRPVKKCIPFVISPHDHVDTKENLKTPTKINIFCDMSKNTPASKIQIYSESTKKINRKTKASCPAIQVNDCAIEASSSNTLVPVQSSLRVRTKLLTEKIKRNAKKSDENSSENIPASGESSGGLRRSRRTKNI